MSRAMITFDHPDECLGLLLHLPEDLDDAVGVIGDAVKIGGNQEESDALLIGETRRDTARSEAEVGEGIAKDVVNEAVDSDEKTR